MTLLSLFFWFLRDGLKVGMVESHGLPAWQRFAGSLPELFAFTPPFIIGCLLFPWKQAKQQPEFGTPEAESAWPPPPRPPDE